MNMKVNKDALDWYKEELELETGDQVRFFVRYGGCSNVQKGFSLGVAKDQPMNAGISTEVEGITFFIEESDLWYFDNHDLSVTYSDQSEEPVFNYVQVRFFVRYGGCSNVQKGFSLGVAKDQPMNAGISTEVEGITFFIEESDLWYFDNHDLSVTYSDQSEEPVFNYV
ncbi:uncharacterized protein BARD7_01778 [Bacillus amyloliquefaciens]|nr:uncharacterized protein BARD7_01778 [Bacillus amyloliquefaciens]